MMQAYSIVDSMTKEWTPPFYQKHDVQAVRAFVHAITEADTNNNLRKWPEQFTLHHIGTWDEETGKLTGEAKGPIITADAALKYNGAKNAE